MNNDGTISTQELHEAIKLCGLNASDDDLRKIVEEIDINNNGSIDFAEFTILFERLLSSDHTLEDVVRAFKSFDSDGNGFISKSELSTLLHAMCGRVDESEIDAMLRMADTNQDGMIDFEEFTAAVRTSNMHVYTAFVIGMNGKVAAK